MDSSVLESISRRAYFSTSCTMFYIIMAFASAVVLLWVRPVLTCGWALVDVAPVLTWGCAASASCPLCLGCAHLAGLSSKVVHAIVYRW